MGTPGGKVYHSRHFQSFVFKAEERTARAKKASTAAAKKRTAERLAREGRRTVGDSRRS
jgi:hypothetical protein